MASTASTNDHPSARSTAYAIEGLRAAPSLQWIRRREWGRAIDVSAKATPFLNHGRSFGFAIVLRPAMKVPHRCAAEELLALRFHPAVDHMCDTVLDDSARVLRRGHRAAQGNTFGNPLVIVAAGHLPRAYASPAVAVSTICRCSLAPRTPTCVRCYATGGCGSRAGSSRTSRGLGGVPLCRRERPSYDLGSSTGDNVWASRAKSQRPSGCLRYIVIR